MNEVGLLKKQRETLGMTQKQLADALGLCSNHIALIERGERRITKQTLLAVECLVLKEADEQIRLLDESELPRSETSET